MLFVRRFLLVAVAPPIKIFIGTHLAVQRCKSVVFYCCCNLFGLCFCLILYNIIIKLKTTENHVSFGFPWVWREKFCFQPILEDKIRVFLERENSISYSQKWLFIWLLEFLEMKC